MKEHFPHIAREILASKKLLVVGDCMLDKYWFGDVSRISPEAPVPIVAVTKTSDRLGGAANVALNITSLGAQSALMSVIGQDDTGRLVSDLLAKAGIGAHLHADPELKTTVKLRIVARQQQLVRVDFENHPSNDVLASQMDEFRKVVADYDVIVLSDYGKGGLTLISEMIAVAKAANKRILVDPKGTDFDKYAGATCITPNRAELERVVGSWRSEEELYEKAQNLRRRLQMPSLLLTRSEEGMTLFTDQGARTIPAQALEVFDVSGAGDTSIAVLATMVACGLSLEQSVEIANRAGGIVVGKFGTATLSYEELFPEPAA